MDSQLHLPPAGNQVELQRDKFAVHDEQSIVFVIKLKDIFR